MSKVYEYHTIPSNAMTINESRGVIEKDQSILHETVMQKIIWIMTKQWSRTGFGRNFIHDIIDGESTREKKCVTDKSCPHISSLLESSGLSALTQVSFPMWKMLSFFLNRIPLLVFHERLTFTFKCKEVYVVSSCRCKKGLVCLACKNHNTLRKSPALTSPEFSLRIRNFNQRRTQSCLPATLSWTLGSVSRTYFQKIWLSRVKLLLLRGNEGERNYHDCRWEKRRRRRGWKKNTSEKTFLFSVKDYDWIKVKYTNSTGIFSVEKMMMSVITFLQALWGTRSAKQAWSVTLKRLQSKMDQRIRRGERTRIKEFDQDCQETHNLSVY